MPITEDQYKRVKAALNQAGDDAAALSPEFRAKAQAAVDEFEGHLVTQLDPELPLMAQALSTQPATNHPGGDAAAEDEWQRNPQGQNGTTIVYEMPLSVAKKDLLEHPEKLGALGYSRIPPTPEDIQGMDTDSSIYHAYNDQKWRETADAATQAGKRAYRYSKAPWLQGGGLSNAIESLGMKLKTSVAPAAEQAAAYVMGADDTALFGVARKGLETVDAVDRAAGGAPAAAPSDTEPVVDPTTGQVMGEAPKAAEDDVVGGVMGTVRAEHGSAKRATELLEEEYPKTYTAGQVSGVAPDLAALGLKGVGKAAGLASEAAGKSIQGLAGGIKSLAPWSASNALYDEVASGGARQLAKLGAKEGGILSSALSAGGGGMAVQAAREGVDAGANLAQTGDTGTSLKDAAERTLEAGVLPAKLGALGSAVQQGAKGYADWVRTGNGSITGGRYQGVPGKLEQAGVEPQLGRGFVAPAAVKAAQKEARELGVPVEQVLADRVAPKLAGPELSVAERKAIGRLGNTRAPATGAADPALESALHKTAVDAPPTLYKGVTLDADALARVEKTGKLDFENYTSSATDKQYAAGYAATGKGKPVVVEFEGLPRAHQKSDREMLVPPGGYQVTGRRVEKIRIPELDREVEATVLTVGAQPKALPHREWSGGELREVKPPATRPAPKSKDAYPAVKGYARGKADVRTVRDLHAAADRAGPEVAQELRGTRVPALLGQLEKLTSPTYKKVADPTVFGTALRFADKANLNVAYPALRSLEGPLGPLAGAQAGRLGTVGKDERKEEAKAKEAEPRSARYEAWRAEYLKRKEAPKPRHRRAH